jgi:hypothetical protein
MPKVKELKEFILDFSDNDIVLYELDGQLGLVEGFEFETIPNEYLPPHLQTVPETKCLKIKI